MVINPSNLAAWVIAPKARPLVVKESRYHSPGPHEIVVKNSAIAINPIDFMIQRDCYLDYLQYPHILGCDVAGEIFELGSEVTGFVVGQRVICHGFGLDSGQEKHGGFQHYTVCLSTLVCPLPAHISFSEGVVLPCAISTAATGLYLESYLGLEYPLLDPQSTKKTLFVWGGASSVGCCAIQLARDSRYEVFTTASPRNHSLCFALGADRYFDYHKNSILDDIVHALREKHVVGFFDAISNSHTIQVCIDVIKRLQLKAKVITTNPVPQNVRSEGIVVKSVLAGEIAEHAIGKLIYQDYLPKALEQDQLRPFPDPLIVGHGLEAVQGGVDRVGQGVSAQKVVITLGP